MTAVLNTHRVNHRLEGPAKSLLGKRIKINQEIYKVFSVTEFTIVPPNGMDCFLELELIGTDRKSYKKYRPEDAYKRENRFKKLKTPPHIRTKLVIKRFIDQRCVIVDRYTKTNAEELKRKI